MSKKEEKTFEIIVGKAEFHGPVLSTQSHNCIWPGKSITITNKFVGYKCFYLE